jgi:hypothetical protein
MYLKNHDIIAEPWNSPTGNQAEDALPSRNSGDAVDQGGGWTELALWSVASRASANIIY